MNSHSSQLGLNAITSLALPSTYSRSSLVIPPLVAERRAFSTESTKKLTRPSVTTFDVEEKKESTITVSKGEKAEKTTSKLDTAPGTISISKPTSAGVDKKEVSIVKKATDATLSALKSFFSLIAKTPGAFWFYMTHPKDFNKKLAELKEAAVKEAQHYWMGSKVRSFNRRFDAKST